VKNLLATLTLVAAAAAGVAVVCYRAGCEPAVHAAAEKGDALAWLRAEFRLDDTQFAAIRRLHEAYAPECAEHCRAIREATRARDALAAARPADPAALAAADRRVQELRAFCETAIARHVRRVAALMAPAEGERYLALVLPKIASFDHAAAPDLRLEHKH
jgi:hypothetical protein